jgi:hypothetical protein
VLGWPGKNKAEKLRHWDSGSRDDAVCDDAAAGLSLVRIQMICEALIGPEPGAGARIGAGDLGLTLK